MEYEDVLKTDQFNNLFWEWFDDLDDTSKKDLVLFSRSSKVLLF